MAPIDELQTLRDRIEMNKEISDGREVLIEFDDILTLLGTAYSDLCHLKLLH